MKNSFAVIVAGLAFCCTLLVGPASPARAEEECTTQGALALALAEVLGIDKTSAADAAAELALRGIGPKLGWDIEACLTPEVAQEIRDSFNDAAGFDRATAMVDPEFDRLYPTEKRGSQLSPAKP